MHGKVYLHSARGDFADTETLPGRHAVPHEPGAPLRWFSCGCGEDHLVRLHRARWMRLLPLLRLYLCAACRRHVLHLRIARRSGYGAVYLPAPPLRAQPQGMLKLLAQLPPLAPRPQRTFQR